MAYDSQFKRDSPPGSVQEELDRIARTSAAESIRDSASSYYQNEEDSCEECKDNMTMDKKMEPIRSFSSKLELDAGLESMFEMAAAATTSDVPEDSDVNPLENVEEEDDVVDGQDDDEFQLVQHLMQPLTPKQLEPSLGAAKTKTKRKGRRKRGSSLERMIAQLILQDSPSGQEEKEASLPATADTPATDSVTVHDILSDLVKTEDAPSAFSGQSKETTPWANTSRSSIPILSSSESIREEESPQSKSLLMAEPESEDEEDPEVSITGDVREEQDLPTENTKDAFGFAVGDDGWTAFDDCPAFDTSLFPSQDLDKNGFPVAGQEMPNDVVEAPESLENDDEFEAEEEELAADLIKEMEREVERDGGENVSGSVQRKDSRQRSRFVADQIAKFESKETEEIRKRLIQQRQQDEARTRDEEEQRSEEEAAFAKQRAEENERLEQSMAKELARRIAKEQEWGKLQEMAEELARKQQEVERNQEQGGRIQTMQSSQETVVQRRPFTFEEVEVSERDGHFSDDEVSSLPTTQSIDSRSLAQFIAKENKISPPATKPQRTASPPIPPKLKRKVSPPAITPQLTTEKKEAEPHSPSSVVDLDPPKSTKNTAAHTSGPMATMATQRFRHSRRVFNNRQQAECSTSPTSRPKPTWNPAPPKHYHRSSNGL